MKLKPCKICGSRNITLWDCGYSSFNPGGGRCENGHEGKGECGCLVDDATRARVWNAAQKLTPMERLQAENKRLRKQIKMVPKNALEENRDRFIKIQDAEVCLAESPDLASLVCSFGSYPPSMRKEALRKIASFCVGFVEEKLKDGVR